jgi:cyclic pyranopterin phosphate synthase
MDKQFTHFDDDGHAQMVDVSEKTETKRVAIARATVRMQAQTRELIETAQMKKGDVLKVAELAGIMGAKKTSDLIPLCHPLPITKVSLVSEWGPDHDHGAELWLTARVETTYRTGVEMEALTACSVAGLTVYDMCKAVDRGMRMDNVKLLYKSGGNSGTYVDSTAEFDV